MSTMRKLSIFSLFVVLAILICPAPTSAQGPPDQSDPLLPSAPPPTSANALQDDPNAAPLAAPSPSNTKYFQFNMEYLNKTVNCSSKSILTVNGQYPGPTIYVDEDDRVIVNVTNNSRENITIHFHGVRQVRSPWMDGVAFVTQCPIRPGGYFTHNFTLPRQRGTLLWHAHYNTQRATVHGAFIISYNKYPTPFPLQINRAFPIIIGEWWNGDIQTIEDDVLEKGVAFPSSDALTINGNAGPYYGCSESDGNSLANSTLDAVPGQTYLLQIVNAAVNTHVYFAVANHTLIVVEVDARYVYPFEASIIPIGPGQTASVLLRANINQRAAGTYYMSISAWGRDNIPRVPVAALFKYPTGNGIFAPSFPAYTDTGYADSFDSSLRGLLPGRVPPIVDHNLFFAVGLSYRYCNLATENCSFPWRVQASINNLTFVLPNNTNFMEASYNNVTGVYTEDFPLTPSVAYDYTYQTPAAPPGVVPGRISNEGTKIVPVGFNETVQIVFQGTLGRFENHPFHLHGHDFYVVGQGFGNFDNVTDPLSFNLWDPPMRNTVGVPMRGWVVIRFLANNPGMWLLHCHLDKHTTWGMQTVFHIRNGNGPLETADPPPAHLVPCDRSE